LIGKKCTSSLFSQSVVGQFIPTLQNLAGMRTANREKPILQKLCNFTWNLFTCPASSASV